MRVRNLALLLALPVPLEAVSATAAPRVAPEVVVSATREEAREFDLPAAIDTVDARVVREDNPQVNLSESLNRIPGIVVQNRELFIYYAVKLLHDYVTNGLRSAGLSAADGGRPIPDTVDTGVLLVTKDNVDTEGGKTNQFIPSNNFACHYKNIWLGENNHC